VKTNRRHSTSRMRAGRLPLGPGRLFGALLFTLVAVSVAACGDDGASNEQSTASSSSSSSGSCLSKIKDSGQLTSAFDGAPPFSFVSATGGEVTGLIPDIQREFMKREGIGELKALTMPFSSMIPALKVGKIDMNGTEISYTPERATEISFTDTIYWNPDTLVVKKGNPHDIHSLEDGAGLKFGTYSGTIYEEYLRDAQKETDFDLQLLPTQKELLAALDAGQLDAGMMDQVGAAYAISKNPGLGVEQASDYTPASPKEAAAVHLAVRKECTDLAEEFDKVYAEMVSDGTRDQILSKWGLEPLDKYTEYSG
jgi:ABC-type amino acid transport substrate-binding protein